MTSCIENAHGREHIMLDDALFILLCALGVNKLQYHRGGSGTQNGSYCCVKFTTISVHTKRTQKRIVKKEVISNKQPQARNQARYASN